MNIFDQYDNVLNKILNEGHDIFNERTGETVRTLVNVMLEYNVGAGEYPLVTTRKSPWRLAIRELLGYLRGYRNSQQFEAIGCKTWQANTNENAAWLANTNRKGEGDMGRAYGVQGRRWIGHDGVGEIEVDQLLDIVTKLRAGVDDRGLILTYWNPGEQKLACLRPCLHTYTFSLLDGTLHMFAVQRSSDWCLGTVANTQHCYVMLELMARMTGHRAGRVKHMNNNAHIYESQLAQAYIQAEREPHGYSKLVFPDIDYSAPLDDVLAVLSADDFVLENYEHHEPIKYPFAV